MRCKYTFEVDGTVKPERIMAFELDDFRFEFEVTDGFITKIFLSFPIDISELPTIEKAAFELITPQINLSYPKFNEVIEIVSGIEGSWSLWGAERIDIDEPLISFEAESKYEETLITINNIKVSIADFDHSNLPRIPPELLIKPIIASVKEKSHDVRLSFYRRGMLDLKSREYIEAFYDFYLMLESTFSEGKTKNSQIEQKLVESTILRDCVLQTVLSSGYANTLPHELKPLYVRKYDSLKYEEFIKKLVSIRGFLHHHNMKRSDNWSPTKQGTYRLEATMLSEICCRVGMHIFFETNERTKTDGAYSELIKRFLSSDTASISLCQ
ncbi:hypothetical protein WG68_08660 [Arsukibacterium ikkense]|uniref:Uncharacterized protein n=1 Tax=Arsukibacterium ikkense TaxID=336831 RepID=A0A0M2V4K3_9GAMM|nr:hypothetical protein [Arsukibacterium ikkense]KKO45777.1 hypothetical protein WG68_08660 [Arsukibacterium ikkense]